VPLILLMSIIIRVKLGTPIFSEVRPRITGWAQVNGRNAISWEEKFKLDVYYVDNRSLWLDIKILLMMVKKFLYVKVFWLTGIQRLKSLRARICDRMLRDYHCKLPQKIIADIAIACGMSDIVFYDDHWHELGQH